MSTHGLDHPLERQEQLAVLLYRKVLIEDPSAAALSRVPPSAFPAMGQKGLDAISFPETGLEANSAEGLSGSLNLWALLLFSSRVSTLLFLSKQLL